MFDEHICNLEQIIRKYQVPIEYDGLEPCVNVGINKQRVLELPD